MLEENKMERISWEYKRLYHLLLTGLSFFPPIPSLIAGNIEVDIAVF